MVSRHLKCRFTNEQQENILLLFSPDIQQATFGDHQVILQLSISIAIESLIGYCHVKTLRCNINHLVTNNILMYLVILSTYFHHYMDRLGIQVNIYLAFQLNPIAT